MDRGAIARVSGAVLLVAALAAFSPPAGLPPLCGFHYLTGRPCPLCGMTRAVFALAKGHWGEAVALNALSPLGFVLLLSLFWNWRQRGRLWTAGLAAFAVYGVVRVVAGC